MPQSYRWAHDVFPEDLCIAAASALGYKTCKITFRRPGAPLGKSERQLPYGLVEKCRNHVWSKMGDDCTNIVYFKSGRSGGQTGLPPRYVKWLLELGYPSGVVQVVVGVSRQTITNYRKLGIQPKGVPAERISSKDFPKAVEAGRDMYLKLGYSSKRPDLFYALLALAVEDVEKHREGWDALDVSRFYRSK